MRPWREPATPRDRAIRDVLVALRAFTDALDRMHSDMKGDMQMGPTDLAALRMLVIREQQGENVSPHDLARHLRISTASTTKLLDRLTASGHVERLRHPHDRRARIVILTDASRAAFREHFGRRLQLMRDVAERYSDQELGTIGNFMTNMSEALDPPESNPV